MKIGVLGVGNMGSAIIEGLANKVDAKNIYAMNHDNPRVTKLSQQIGFELFNDLKQFKQITLDAIIATIPAPITVDTLAQLDGIDQNTVIISAAGGVKIESIKEVLPNNPIVSIVPNTPVSVNAGTIATCFDAASDKAQVIATNILNLLGNVITTKEANLGIMGTVGGCGPAFVDLFMDAMADAAVESGLDRNSAYEVIASMVAGSGQLAFKTGKTPAELKDQVTSPGGTTIQGVTELEANGFRNAVIKATKRANSDM
ncbi:pyrroline-5-carboxylate reductase [Nicoliella lavandulae]|uniref:Pyrroline-5-carboxylate reductase n=1 Tax=Nicoliella lavandulae TaxID=3082954 RepID=A0ABU8SLZ3_9LACO